MVKRRHTALADMGRLSGNQGASSGDGGSVRKIDLATEKQIPRCARDDRGAGVDLIRLIRYPSWYRVVSRLFQQAPKEPEFVLTAPFGRGSFARLVGRGSA